MTTSPEQATYPYTTRRARRLEFAPTTPLRVPGLPAERIATRTPRSDRRADGNDSAVPAIRARELVCSTQRALAVGDLDRATSSAERLLELAATGKDASVLRVLAEHAAFLNRVFEDRVGPPERRIEVGIAGLGPGDLALSQRATELVELARGGTTVRELLASCGFPRRHAARMLAGLLRRHVLVAL